MATGAGEEMKTYTPQNIEVMIDGIIAEKEKQCGSQFNGMPHNEVMNELYNKLGDDWCIKREQPIRFTKQDINAVANNRFYRRTGVKLLMLLIIVVLGLAVFTTTFKLIPIPIYYGLSGLAAAIIFYIYSKKQQKARKEFWDSIEGGGIEQG